MALPKSYGLARGWPFSPGQASLNTINIPKAKRATITPVGDSRCPEFLDPATKRNKGGASPINNLCALAFQKYSLQDSFGQSGKTPAEYLTALPQAIAGNPGAIVFPSALNALGQDIPSATTSGSDSAGRLIEAANTCVSAGIVAIFISEVGQVGLTASRREQVDIYNRMLQNHANTTKGVVFIDLRPKFCDANNVVRTEFTYDGTHWNQYGAWLVAQEIKPIFDLIMPSGLDFSINPDGSSSVAGYTQILPNPRFLTATGGSTATGATGSFSGSCRYNKSGAGSALAVTSVSGSTTLAGTFTAQNDNVRMTQDSAISSWSFGDTLKGMSVVTINAPPVNLAGISMQYQIFYDSTSIAYQDMVPNATWAGPNGTTQMMFLTQDYVIPTGTTKVSATVTVTATAFGAGSVNFTINQIGLFKKV